MSEHSEAQPAKIKPRWFLADAPACANMFYFGLLALVLGNSEIGVVLGLWLELFKAIALVSMLVGLIGSVIWIATMREECASAWLGLLTNLAFLFFWALLAVSRMF